MLVTTTLLLCAAVSVGWRHWRRCDGRQLCWTKFVQTLLGGFNQTHHFGGASNVVAPLSQMLQSIQLSVNTCHQRSPCFGQSNFWDNECDTKLFAEAQQLDENLPTLPHYPDDEIRFHRKHRPHLLCRCSSRHSSAHLRLSSNGIPSVNLRMRLMVSSSSKVARSISSGSINSNRLCSFVNLRCGLRLVPFLTLLLGIFASPHARILALAFANCLRLQKGGDLS